MENPLELIMERLGSWEIFELKTIKCLVLSIFEIEKLFNNFLVNYYNAT